nr:pentatricopeptide repeat-containing protein At1g79490, mitochondrial [Tanacetum cinerariifolium]
IILPLPSDANISENEFSARPEVMQDTQGWAIKSLTSYATPVASMVAEFVKVAERRVVTSDEVYVSLIERLNECRDFDGIQSLFDDLVDDDKVKVNGFSAFSRIVQCLAKADKLEVSFCCFKKSQESGCRVDTTTYNLLIIFFLEKGLPFKAFEIYENMEGSGCSLDGGTYELMIPSLAKSGRIDAALKLFQQMKEKNIQPGFTIFSSLVDSLGKAGRLDTAMKAYMEMQGFGIKPSAMMFVSIIESYVKAGKLEIGLKIWDEMKKARFRPNYGLYTMIVESHAKSGKLETAMSVFSDMEKVGFLPTPSTYSCLLEMHASSGRVDDAMKLYNSMSNAGVRPGLSTFSALLTLLAKKKLVDIDTKILLEMKAMGYAVDVTANDVLMVFIKEASVDHALRWLRFMGSSGIRTNNFIIRQLFESCMKNGFYESAKPLLENYVESAVKVDLILYTSILAHLARCQDEQSEGHLMSILSATKHKAHKFMCGLFTGPEQRKQPVLAFVREFFQNIDYESGEGAARFRKRMLYYGVVPRRIKLVTGPTLKIVIAQMLSSVESPFEVSKVVLRAPGDSVSEWFKKPIVQQFLLNEMPSRSDILMHNTFS